LKTVALRSGRVVVTVPKRFQTRKGKHRIRAVYRGSASTASSSATTTWRVR
jgi:hypothetical protein